MKAAGVEIRVGLGSCGVASGAQQVRDALVRAAGDGIVKSVGCNGMCHREPMVEVVERGRATLYGNVTPEAARLIARRHLRPRLLRFGGGVAPDGVPAAAIDGYLGKQERI